MQERVELHGRPQCPHRSRHGREELQSDRMAGSHHCWYVVDRFQVETIIYLSIYTMSVVFFTHICNVSG